MFGVKLVLTISRFGVVIQDGTNSFPVCSQLIHPIYGEKHVDYGDLETQWGSSISVELPFG